MARFPGPDIMRDSSTTPSGGFGHLVLNTADGFPRRALRGASYPHQHYQPLSGDASLKGLSMERSSLPTADWPREPPRRSVTCLGLIFPAGPTGLRGRVRSAG